jgi:hypothetical protein
MYFAAGISANNALFEHDLHQFQGGGVPRNFMLTQGFMHFSNAGLFPVP